MSDNEKRISKIFWISFTVAILAIAAGAITWLLSTGKLSSNSMALGKKDDVAPSHITEMSVAGQNAEADSSSTLMKVMFEGSGIYDCVKGENLTLSDILAGGKIVNYTMLDMNADAKKDLVLRLEKDGGSLLYVLMENGHGVWGLEFSKTNMENIYATGVYQGTNGGATTYYVIQTSDDKIVNKQIGDDTGLDFQALQDGDEEMKAVSRVEFIEFINGKCGTVIQDYKDYSEEELRKDLENPDGFNLVKEKEFGEDYWSALICELPQYNGEMGKSYEAFIKGDEEYYTEEAKWMHDAEEIFCWTNLENGRAIGATESIYDAEYVLFEDNQAIMLGALMNNTEAYVSDFIVDGNFDVEPAIFAIPAKTDNDMGSDALVWSCDDTYLVVFSTPDTRDEDFYNRPVWAVCYVKKAHCGITRYPLEVIPEMSAELE